MSKTVSDTYSVLFLFYIARQTTSRNREIEAVMKESKKSNSSISRVISYNRKIDNTIFSEKEADYNTSHIKNENVDISAGIGMIVINNALEVVLFSPAVFQILCIDPQQNEELLTKIAGRFSDAFLIDNIKIVIKQRQSIERIVHTPDNKAYIINLSPSITPVNEVSGVLISFIDITQRIKEEEHSVVPKETAMAISQETDKTIPNNTGKANTTVLDDLHRSNEKYNQLVQCIDEGYCIIEMVFDEHHKPVDYIFLETNDAFNRQTGIENALGKTMRSLAPSHEQHWFDIYGSIAITGQALRFQNNAKELDRFFDVYAFRIGTPTEKKVAVLFNDISEQKRAENNLAFLFEITHDLIYTENVDQIIHIVGKKIGSYLNLSRCAFVKVNETVNEVDVICDWHLANMPDLTGTYNLTDFTTPVFRSRAREGKSLVVNDVILYNPSKESYYHSLRVKSFISVPLLVNNEWPFFMSLCHSESHIWRNDEIRLVEELTARIWSTLKRKGTETELQQSEERLRLTIEAGKVGTCDHNLKTNQSICNDERYKMYGLIPQAEPIEVSKLFACIHPDDAGNIKQEFEVSIKKNGRYAEEYRVVHPDGSIRWISQTGEVIEWEAGEPVRVLSILSDITERKMEEKQKDDFISIASHELKTPVTSIKAYTEILEYIFRTANDEYSASMMSRLNGQVDRLTSLIINLLDTTKIFEGRMDLFTEEIDIGELLKETIEDIKHTSAYHIIRLTTEPSLRLIGDKKRIGQVFTNLLSNAIKYTPAGYPPVTADILVNAVYEDREIKISFQDYGIGMSSGTLIHLFQRFFRSDNPEHHTYPGLGLGLYISKQIISRHGGDITVISKKGKGSTFTITLPAI